MDQKYYGSKPKYRYRALIIIAAAAAVWFTAPFAVRWASTTAHADVVPTTTLVANLAPPAVTTVPATGIGVYTTATVGNVTGRSLRVEVFNITATPAAVSLGVFVNSASVGTMTTDATGHGILNLSTNNGGTVPNIVAGDSLTVKNGTATLLGGVFGTPPTPTPTPNTSPTPTPVPPVHLWAGLAGPAIDGMTPRGLGQFDSFGTMRELKVYVSYVNLPEGTTLTVSTGSANTAAGAVGTIVLHNRSGSLVRTGAAVPAITAGTAIVVRNGTAIVLSGVFGTSPPPPTPTPTPSGSPTPTPTPHPPMPTTGFISKMTGANVVPPVTTDGRGYGLLRIVPATTATANTNIVVRVAYNHLSSVATTITINGPAATTANGPVIFTIPNNGGTSGYTDVAHFSITAEQLVQLRAGLWYFQIATTGNSSGEVRGQIRSANMRSDFDGDGRSDIAVVRTAPGAAPNAANIWYTLNSSDYTMAASVIGDPGDVNVQGDYDGDGIADIAMYTPATGVWQIRQSETGETRLVQFGAAGDTPIVGDYDGDGINDVSVFRPTTGDWYTLRSSDGSFSASHWGAKFDRPVIGDFDGDGTNDLAVFRPSDGDWYILRSSDNEMTAIHWGLNGDRPVSGDFDGDGSSDIAVYRPSLGDWYIYRSSDHQLAAYHFGTAGDLPVACEFDGDGSTDIAVFRPSDGNWYIYNSSTRSMSVYHFGIDSDRPIPSAYNP